MSITRISVLDSTPVPAGRSAHDAFEASASLARHADALGYTRYWATELHGGPMNAGTAPEVTIARAGAVTSRIRLGSGAALLNQRSPFRTAEAFQQLNAMFPGRIDLGLGRATAGPVVDFALSQTRDRMPAAVDDQADRVHEVLAWLAGGFPDTHPFASVSMLDSAQGSPDVWVLGSSPSSAVLAASLGLPYAFAGFLAPHVAPVALAAYRERFTPGDQRTQPYAILALNVACAPSADQAGRLGASAAAVYAGVGLGQRLPRIPGPDDAVALLGGTPPCADRKRIPWPQTVAGDPGRVADCLTSMAEEVGADEIMIQDFIFDPGDRLRSYQLIAEALDISASRGREARPAAAGSAVA